MQFLPCYDHDLYFDGRLIKPMNWFPGATSIYDLRLDPVADVRDPFHSLMFHLPRKALDAMAYFKDALFSSFTRRSCQGASPPGGKPRFMPP